MLATFLVSNHPLCLTQAPPCPSAWVCFVVLALLFLAGVADLDYLFQDVPALIQLPLVDEAPTELFTSSNHLALVSAMVKQCLELGTCSFPVLRRFFNLAKGEASFIVVWCRLEHTVDKAGSTFMVLGRVVWDKGNSKRSVEGDLNLWQLDTAF